MPGSRRRNAGPDAKATAQTMAWKGLAIGCGVLAGVAVERVLGMIWQAIAKQDPPTEAADRRRPLLAAVLWGAAAGLLGGIVRVLLQRGASTAWETAASDTPPGVGASS